MQLPQILLAVTLFLGLAFALPLPQTGSSLAKRPTAVEYRADSIEELPVPVSPPAARTPPVVVYQPVPVPPPDPPRSLRKRPTAVEYRVGSVEEYPTPVVSAAGSGGGRKTVRFAPVPGPPIPPRDTGVSGGKTSRSNDDPPPTADNTGAKGGKTTRSDDLPVPPPLPPTTGTTSSPDDASAISSTRTIGTSQRKHGFPTFPVPLPESLLRGRTRRDDPDLSPWSPKLISIAAIAAKWDGQPGEDGAEKM
jgi:hypothetical protein